MPDLDYILRRAVAEIVVERELRALLEKGQPLRLKMGFDPSRPDLHLGYAVALRKLRQFQELGHQVILIVGDWTARIGDPSGQSEARQMLSEEQVNANAQTYMRQFFKIVDKDKTQVVFQSEWFGKFTLGDVVQLTSRFTVAQMLAREDFGQRYASQKPIALTEFLYPLLQGYDSVAIRSDVEFGGTDQKFNCLVGRDLQGMVGQRPQQVFLTPLLLGTDGRKMSQSYGNYIAFDTPPKDMYGKVMSIPDSIMPDYFELLTDVPDEELAKMRRQMDGGAVNPMEYKLRLAKEIVTQFHSEAAARDAEAHFRRVVQQRDAPEEIPEFSFPLHDRENRFPFTVLPPTDPSQDARVDLARLIGFYTDLEKSTNEAKKRLQEGAVKLDGRRHIDRYAHVPRDIRSGTVIQVGSRRFLRIRIIDAP